MRKALRPVLAEGAAEHIRERIVETSASRPVVQSSRRVGVGEQGKDHGDLKQGNARVKMLAGPSGSSFVNKVFESRGVHNFVEKF